MNIEDQEEAEMVQKNKNSTLGANMKKSRQQQNWNNEQVQNRSV